MKKVFLALVFLLLTAVPVRAGELRLDPLVSLEAPDGWDSLGIGALHRAPEEVAAVIDCAGEDPGEVKILGWKLSETGEFQAAYCVSLQKQGMGRMRDILKSSAGSDRQKASDKFIDTFASTLKQEYTLKRKMALSDLSADLMDADNDVFMIMDGKVSSRDKELWRSLNVFLHDDSLLNISFIYDVRAPEGLVRELDSMLTTITWN